MPIPGLAKTPIIYVGSVKNLRRRKPATAKSPGILWFEYTDDYSVFDYGKMPDRIPDKGAAAAMMTAVLFEQAATPSTWRAFDVPETWGQIKDKGLREELRNSPVLAEWKKTGAPTHYLHRWRSDSLPQENLHGREAEPKAMGPRMGAQDMERT